MVSFGEPGGMPLPKFSPSPRDNIRFLWATSMITLSGAGIWLSHVIIWRAALWHLETGWSIYIRIQPSRQNWRPLVRESALYVTVTLFACQTPVISLWGTHQQEGAGEGMVGKNNGNFEMPFSWHNYHIDVCAIIFLPLQRRPLSIPPRPSQPS